MSKIDTIAVNRTSVKTGLGVRSAFSDVPTCGRPIEVADGVWWIRLPLSSALDHVNVYALGDNDGWTLIDTGNNTEVCRAELQAVFEHGALAHKPVTRVLATHYHPDHIGLAGWWANLGARFCATQVCWLTARMLQLDARSLPYEDQIGFAERAGIKGMALAAYRRHPPSTYPQLVSPIPYAYSRLEEGDELRIGKRCWRVLVDHGHAAGHLTLWSDDGLGITGDQILPGIAPNLSVSSHEPDADVVTEWIESCRRLSFVASDETLCLPGHNGPFYGAPARCEQLIANVEAALARLLDRLNRPATAVECLDAVYRRPLSSNEQSALIAETIGFLNHLWKRNLVCRDLARDGAYLWRLAPKSS